MGFTFHAVTVEFASSATTNYRESKFRRLGVIKTFFGLIILVAMLISGFWLSGIYTPYVSPSGEYWAMLNSKLPTCAQNWACEEIRNRSGQAPAYCAPSGPTHF